MNKRFTAIPFVAALFASCASGQGTFQNLDFEDARIILENTGLQGQIATTNALPGWTAFDGTNQSDIVQYETPGGFDLVNLVSHTNRLTGGAIDGNFSVILSWFGSTGGSISQTGLNPADARTLLFKGGNGLVVSLGGQSLSYEAVSASDHIFGVDISSYAGQTESLRFAAPFNSGFGLDNIQFSSLPIPEPSASALIFLAGGIFFRARRWRTRQVESTRT